MTQDVNCYVRGYSICAISKSPCHLPEGKLLPLPIPQRPWSRSWLNSIRLKHLKHQSCCGLFLEDLSTHTPQGITLCYGDSGSLVPPCVTLNYLRTLGQIKDHSSLKAFFQLLDVSVSLSSRHHPQSNEQTEILDTTWGHTATINSTAGINTFLGPSMHKTHYVKTPLISHSSSVYSVTNLPCFPGKVSHQKFQLSTIGCRRARGYGTQHTTTCSGQ